MIVSLDEELRLLSRVIYRGDLRCSKPLSNLYSLVSLSVIRDYTAARFHRAWR